MTDPPIYVNCRDRLRDLRKLVAWLEKAGHERIVLLDNASTFPPLLDFYEQIEHEVVRLQWNFGSRALWLSEQVPGEPFVYTDPDVVPTDNCPLDAVARLAELLDRYPAYSKAGLGLYLDDVPGSLASLDWERSLVGVPSGQFPVPRGVELEPGVFDSLVDTTFALYRPGTPHGLHGLRLGAPYQVRHMPWYVTVPDIEDRYYLDHATAGPLGSSWAQNARVQG